VLQEEKESENEEGEETESVDTTAATKAALTLGSIKTNPATFFSKVQPVTPNSTTR